MEKKNALGFRLIKIASIYLLIGLVLGLYMGVTHVFALISAHSHISLLGLASMALVGLIYVVVPRCDGNKPSKVHFWLHNFGLPVMILGLVWNQNSPGGPAEAVIGIGSALVFVALSSFFPNLFKYCKSE
jgi:hypothetical protein